MKPDRGFPACGRLTATVWTVPASAWLLLGVLMATAAVTAGALNLARRAHEELRGAQGSTVDLRVDVAALGDAAQDLRDSLFEQRRRQP